MQTNPNELSCWTQAREMGLGAAPVPAKASRRPEMGLANHHCPRSRHP
ncbi:hypothetical protein B0G57_1424 [Trinickia symbiotica]|nr:hypothetical protein B0G57_1424 [Trinickia symbiotica]